jgi:uncharacterized protein (TIGR00730 family)
MKKYLAVYCGASKGLNPIYEQQAKALGQTMVKLGYHLVYGAGNVGLMGVIADEVLKLGGEVVGVIPQHLVDREVAHTNCTELVVTQTMHERKAIIAERSDGFVAMPGGIGTLEEVIEIMTWNQLGLHQKPIAFYDVDGYYSKLFDFFEHMKEEQFLKEVTINQLICESDPVTLMKGIQSYSGEYTPKWL